MPHHRWDMTPRFAHLLQTHTQGLDGVGRISGPVNVIEEAEHCDKAFGA